ncbi:MAG TPA: hypothetical protein VNV86_07190, partial [Candidatus Acidoferrum sp.]|nr:hypothetical protein [Candidatus Acidoferrum sp.]
HNRFAWDLRYALPGQEESPFGRAPEGPLAVPGMYQVKLTAAGNSATQPLKVVMDPRSTATPAELQKVFDLSMSIVRDMLRTSEAIAEAAAARRAKPELEREIAQIAGAGGGRGGRGGAVMGVTLASVNQMLSTALGVAGSADRTPPATAYEIAATASKELTRLLAEWKTLRDTKLK